MELVKLSPSACLLLCGSHLGYLSAYSAFTPLLIFYTLLYGVGMDFSWLCLLSFCSLISGWLALHEGTSAGVLKEPVSSGFCVARVVLCFVSRSLFSGHFYHLEIFLDSGNPSLRPFRARDDGFLMLLA